MINKVKYNFSSKLFFYSLLIKHMKILNSTNKITPKINFQSSSREYIDDNLRYTNCTTGQILTCTNILRDDLEWENFAKIIQENFKDKEKVQCFSLGCSDGSEAYSLAIMLDDIGEELDKYSILAVDRDPEIIKYANQRRINLEQGDFGALGKVLKNKREYFINEDDAIDIPNEMYYKLYRSYEPIDRIKKPVTFEQNDVIRTIRKIKDDGNTVLMLRNIMPYIATKRHEEIFYTIKKVLKKGSLLVVGNYDTYTKFEQLLEHHTYCKHDFAVVGKRIFKRL